MRRAAALALSAALLAALPARAEPLVSRDQHTNAERSVYDHSLFPENFYTIVGGSVYYTNGTVNSPDHDYIDLTGNSASHDQGAAFGGAIVGVLATTLVLLPKRKKKETAPEAV